MECLLLDYVALSGEFLAFWGCCGADHYGFVCAAAYYVQLAFEALELKQYFVSYDLSNFVELLLKVKF